MMTKKRRELFKTRTARSRTKRRRRVNPLSPFKIPFL